MSARSLRPSDTLELKPGVTMFQVGERIVGVGSQGGLFGLEQLDVGGLRAILGRVDGQRTVGEVVATLEREFDADDVLLLLEQLEGTVLRHVEAAPSTRAASNVCVLGAGAMAAEIRRELSSDGLWRVTGIEEQRFASCETEEYRRRLRETVLVSPEPTDCSGSAPLTVEALRDRFSDCALVVCALEGVVGQALLDVNAACLSANTPVCFVAIEGNACVVGPTVVPWRTPCFACSRLSTTFKTHHDDLGPTLLPYLSYGSIVASTPRWLQHRAAAELADEARRVILGTPYPARIGELLLVEASGETRTAEIGAVTTCPACRGHHRAALLDADATPPDRRLTRLSTEIRDRAGGVRCVTPEQARRRAERALERLAIEIDCRPLPDSAPPELVSIECPYYDTRHTRRFSTTAPVILKRTTDSCFGKGTTDEQARCSALFEWMERNLADWQGDMDLVRASYRRVRDRAIDVPFLAAGLLPGLPLHKTRLFDVDEEIDWVWGHCLRRDRPILVPAVCTFLGGTLFRGSWLELPARGSSGLSAGCSVADAILQGLLEIVERDACHVAVRNGLELPQINPETLTDPATRDLVRRMAVAGYAPIIRDITSSIAIPTFEAYLLRDGEFMHHFAMGFGAHIDPEIAIRRAVTEAAQSLFYDISVEAEDYLRTAASFFEFYPLRKQVVERRGSTKSLDSVERVAEIGAGIWEQIDCVVRRIGSAIPAADVCAIDLSRPEVEGVHVVRTLVSGTLDEVRDVQVHVPERCRLVPLHEMYLGRLPL